MQTTLILTPLLFKTTGSLRPILLLFTVLLGVAALYASRKGSRRVATALYTSVIAVVLLSVLAVAPRPLAEQPFPDAQETADAARQLVSGGGYVTYVHENVRHPPRYPPGFSIALAPFAAVGDYPLNVQRGATFYAALYVLFAAAAAWSLRGPAAGALLAVLFGISPFVRVEASLVMSDGFAAGLTALLIPLLLRPTPKRIALAGALAGALVAIRLPMSVNLVALLIVLPWALRKRLLLFAAPPLAALALFNWLTYGGPFRTGYDYWRPGLKDFALSFALAPQQGDGPWVVADVLGGLLLRWLCPCPVGGPQAAMSNLSFYPSVLLGLFWIFVPPFIPLVGLLYGWVRRREPAVRFAFCLTVLSLLLFTFYFYQGARFMAAPATLLGVFAAAQLAGWIERGAGVPLPPDDSTHTSLDTHSP